MTGVADHAEARVASRISGWFRSRASSTFCVRCSMKQTPDGADCSRAASSGSAIGFIRRGCSRTRAIEAPADRARCRTMRGSTGMVWCARCRCLSAMGLQEICRENMRRNTTRNTRRNTSGIAWRPARRCPMRLVHRGPFEMSCGGACTRVSGLPSRRSACMPRGWLSSMERGSICCAGVACSCRSHRRVKCMRVGRMRSR